MNEERFFVRKNDRDDWYAVSDGAVVRQGDKLYNLNVTAAEIYALFNGSMSVGDVVDEMEKRYVGTENTRMLVARFIDELAHAGLLVEK
jgi:hypothetical protein